jgi:hypothetical protein
MSRTAILERAAGCTRDRSPSQFAERGSEPRRAKDACGLTSDGFWRDGVGPYARLAVLRGVESVRRRGLEPLCLAALAPQANLASCRVSQTIMLLVSLDRQPSKFNV